MTPAQQPPAGEAGKQVSWVELYLDLVFVLVIAQLARIVIGDPHLGIVWVTLGLFVAVWWTWVGFTVLYNRHGLDGPLQRGVFLAASVPVAAAVTRVVLAVGNAHDEDPDSAVGDALRRRTVRAYATSVLLFLVSIWAPHPLRYPLWAIAYLQESAVMLGGTGPATYLRHRVMGTRRQSGDRAARADDSGAALDAHHFAERFGLFIIILLGEVVAEAGEAASEGRMPTAATWTGLVAAMVLAAALWWTYFTAAAELDLTALSDAGGSPGVARAIFAAGHMIPAFGVLMCAAGIGLLLRGSPPSLAFWLTCVGAGMFLSGTRARTRRPDGRRARLVRTAEMAVTYAFGALHQLVAPAAYLWILALWMSALVALDARTARAGDLSPARA